MKGGYLRQFLAILCRLADALTSRLSSTPIQASDFFLEDAKFSTSSLIVRNFTLIAYHISCFWLAPLNATRFAVAPSSDPAVMKFDRRDEIFKYPTFSQSMQSQKTS